MSPTVAGIVSPIVAYIVARALNPLSKAAEDGAGAEVGAESRPGMGKRAGQSLSTTIDNLLKFFAGVV